MIRLILIPTLIALSLAWGMSYFSASLNGEKAFQKNKLEVEKSAKKRREKICEELKSLLPENTETAINVINDEIGKAGRREFIRWEK